MKNYYEMLKTNASNTLHFFENHPEIIPSELAAREDEEFYRYAVNAWTKFIETTLGTSASYEIKIVRPDSNGEVHLDPVSAPKTNINPLLSEKCFSFERIHHSHFPRYAINLTPDAVEELMSFAENQ